MAVNSATDSTTVSANALAQASAATAQRTAAAQDQFMTLLVTQLKNQDPLNPMDNAQVTSQLAQLETVNGITQLNTTLQALSGQMDLSQSMQAANLIGKDVLFPGEKVSLGTVTNNGVTSVEATPFGVDVISPAAKLVATIHDGSGKVVRTLNLDSQPAGVLQLSWDGKDDAGSTVPAGAYTLQVSATDANGGAVSAQALTYGKVASVSYASSGLQMDLGLAGVHSLYDIRKIM
ncbi:MAG: flagellar basal body rod modification protein [Burkholderiaceae bacterium]|nr:MAG: flagellar basal body rod modification protein [Burkholderiaceae bacterium]TAL99976.1 MAG: flagellar basal body rod modification protein [Pusillimonas sp.]